MVYWKGTKQHHESQQTGQSKPEGSAYISNSRKGFLIRSAILLIILFLYYPLFSYISKNPLQSPNVQSSALNNLRASDYSETEIPASSNTSGDQQSVSSSADVGSTQSSGYPSAVSSDNTTSSQNSTYIDVNGKQVNVSGNGSVKETINSNGTKTNVNVQSNSQSSNVNLNVSSSTNGD